MKTKSGDKVRDGDFKKSHQLGLIRVDFDRFVANVKDQSENTEFGSKIYSYYHHPAAIKLYFTDIEEYTSEKVDIQNETLSSVAY